MMLFKDYQEALGWLFSQSRGGQPRDPGRMRRLIGALELRQPPLVFHVVGTTGKGTVASMLAAACQAAGLRSGLFISPHVEDFRERISVDGAQISESEVLDFVRRVGPLDLQAAFFELALALALEHFSNEGVQVATIEAGVGAKRDATIVVDNVLCTVLTNVGEDHLDTLGPTVEDVARDKAHAIRPGVPVVTGATGETLEVIRQVAGERSSPLYIDTPDDPRFAPPEGLPQTHAIRFSSQRLAAAALRVSGLNISEAAIAAGLGTSPLPARAEWFSLGGCRVLLDGAHNPSAARALAGILERPYLLVFGSLARKAGEETLAELEPQALRTYMTQVDDKPSGIREAPTRIFINNPIEALEQALADCPADADVVVTGSFYLAGQLRPYLKARARTLRVA